MTCDVLVTGAGCIGPMGRNLDEMALALGAGRRGFEVRSEGGEGGPEVALLEDFVFRDWITTRSKRTKKMDRVAQFASVAALLALRDGGFISEQGPVDPAFGEDFGIVTGSAFAVMESIAEFHGQLATEGPDRVDPKLFPNTSHNVPCAHVTIEFGLRGAMLNLCSGPESGSLALALARSMILRGRARRLLVGGFDALGPTSLSGLAAACRGRSRLFEGATFVVLEKATAAAERGREARSRLLGSVLGDGSPWEETLERLLVETGASVEGIGEIVVVSEDRGGKAEGEALARILPKVPVLSLGERLGEGLAQGGPIGTLAAMLLRDGRVPGRDRAEGKVLVSDSGPSGRGAALLLG